MGNIAFHKVKRSYRSEKNRARIFQLYFDKDYNHKLYLQYLYA